MDGLSIFIIVALGVWFVLGIIFMYKRRGKGCQGCCENCAGCGRRKEYEKECQEEEER